MSYARSLFDGRTHYSRQRRQSGMTALELARIQYLQRPEPAFQEGQTLATPSGKKMRVLRMYHAPLVGYRYYLEDEQKRQVSYLEAELMPLQIANVPPVGTASQINQAEHDDYSIWIEHLVQWVEARLVA